MTTVTDTPTRADVSATPTTMRAAVVKTAGAPLVVTDLSQLTATLVATITGATTTGNLLSEGGGNFGALAGSGMSTSKNFTG